MKECKGCLQLKDESEFSYNPRKEDRLHDLCNQCVAGISQESLVTARNYTDSVKRKRTTLLEKNNPYANIIQVIEKFCKENHIDFNLEEKDLLNIPERCPILDIPLKMPHSYGKTTDDHSVTVDRIDPNKGYTKDNILIISRRASNIRKAGSLDEFNKILKFFQKLRIWYP